MAQHGRRSGAYSIIISAALAAVLLLSIASADVSAQTFRYLDVSGNVIPGSASMTYQPKTHVSGGGDITLTSYRVSTGALLPINDSLKFGLRLAYEFNDYNFSRLEGFAVPDPWNKTHRVGLAPIFLYRLRPEWNLFAGPIAEYSAEQGSDFGKSLMYGGVLGAVYQAKPNLRIGLAAGAFYRLEQTVIFPSLLVSWRITDQLRLGNTNRLGPAGPAGLELSYTPDRAWEVGLGAGFRSNRFRLDSKGVVPSGIGQNTSAPVYVRVGHRLGPHFFVDVYGGAAFGGNLRLEDRKGNEIDSVNYNVAPIMGLTLSGFF